MLEIADKLAGTYINVDGYAGNQCWDSAARVSQLMGLPVINTGGKGRWPGWAGNMWDAFPQSPEIDAAYYRVGPDQPAMPGDKAIWGDSYYYYPATHVADVIADAGGLLLCLSQNSSAAQPGLPGYDTDSSGPTIIQHLPKQGLLGYIRPRAGVVLQGEIIQTEEDIMATLEEVRTVVREEIAALTQEGEENKRNAGPLFGVSGNVKAAKVAAEQSLELLLPGQEKVRYAGPIPTMLASIQGQQAGLMEAVKQLAAKPGSPVDLAAIEAASERGAASALADLQATATTTVTLQQEG